MRKKSSFPLEVIVRRNRVDEGDTFLYVADEDEAFQDGEMVGIYQLKDVRRAKVTQTLEQE